MRGSSQTFAIRKRGYGDGKVAGILIGFDGKAVAIADARHSGVRLAMGERWPYAVQPDSVEHLPLGFVEGHRVAQADRELVAPDFDAASVVGEGDPRHKAQRPFVVLVTKMAHTPFISLRCLLTLIPS